MIMLAFFTRCGISYILGQFMELFTYHWHIARLLPLLSETLYLPMGPLENLLLYTYHKNHLQENEGHKEI